MATMTLQEAWLELIDMENYEKLSPSQIYSILSDYGIFKENPKLRLVVKSALEYGVWQCILANPSENIVSNIKLKLENDGFSESVIEQFVRTFYHDDQIKEDSKNLSQDSDESTILNINQYSSREDINNYLNSILEIDNYSFIKTGLTLQDISKIDVDIEIGNYGLKTPYIQLSYEIIGNNSHTLYLNLYIYDNNGFLREICWIDSLFMKDNYSIINETKKIYINLFPHDISKIILKIDYHYTIARFFDQKADKVRKFTGLIENEIKNIKLLETQILYNDTNDSGELSFYLRFNVISPITDIRKSTPNYYAAIIDKNGRLRQKCSIQTLMSISKLNLYKALSKVEYFILSEKSYNNPNKLKIPFEEIKKIILIEDSN